MTRKVRHTPRKPQRPTVIRWENPLIFNDPLNAPKGHYPYTPEMLSDLLDAIPDHEGDKFMATVDSHDGAKLAELLASLSKRYLPGDAEWALMRDIYYGSKR